MSIETMNDFINTVLYTGCKVSEYEKIHVNKNIFVKFKKDNNLSENNKYIFAYLYTLITYYYPNDKLLLKLFDIIYTGYDPYEMKNLQELYITSISDTTNINIYTSELPRYILRIYIDEYIKEAGYIVDKLIKYIYSGTLLSDSRFLELRRYHIDQIRDGDFAQFNILDYMDTNNFAQCMRDLRDGAIYNNFNIIYIKKQEIINKYRPVIFRNGSDSFLIPDEKDTIFPESTLAELFPYSWLKSKRKLHNIKRTKDELPDYMDYDFLTQQQKLSIGAMEDLEYSSSCFLDIETRDEVLLNRIYVKTRFGILSNMPGTGKTRIAVMVAMRNKTSGFKKERYFSNLEYYLEDIESPGEYMRIEYEPRIKIPDYESKEYEYKDYESKVYRPQTLIVVPSSIYTQWKDEINFITNKLNIKDIEILCINRYRKDTVIHQYDTANAKQYDIILTTDSYFNKYIKDMYFDRIIFDEPDSVRYNVEKNNVYYRFKWLVSASIKDNRYKIHYPLPKSNIVSSFIDIKDNKQGPQKQDEFSSMLFDNKSKIPYSDNHNLKGILYRNFSVFFAAEIDNKHKICFKLYKNLKDNLFVNTFRDILNLLDGSLVEDISSNKLYSTIEYFDKKDMCIFDKIYLTITKTIESKENEGSDMINKIAETDNKIAELLTHKNECIICLSDVLEDSISKEENSISKEENSISKEDVYIIDCCPWLICKSCVDESIKNNKIEKKNNALYQTKCTTCNKYYIPVYNLKDTIFFSRFKPENIKSENIVSVSKKTRSDYLKDICLDNTDGNTRKHIILYATSNENSILIKTLNEFNIKYNILAGSVDKKDRIVQKWKKGEAKILVLLTHANIAGLNLVEATDIIVYNYVTSSVLLQIVGRVDRYGMPENHNVNIHLLHPEDIQIPNRYS